MEILPAAEPEPKKETEGETRAAVLRIKKAVADTKSDMKAEKAGTKAAHRPPRWARKSA